MSFDAGDFPKVLRVLLELHEYPTLAPQIRELMRREIFARGVISSEDFDAEVREKAVQSQAREGVQPHREPHDSWLVRLRITQDNLTDFYFAYNLPHELFEQLVRETLTQVGRPSDVALTFHPELAPWDMLFAQGEAYEALPEEDRAAVEHHLQEIKVVLVKSMISDHLDYVGIARDWLSMQDLRDIRRRRIGRGKIGGKAAGIELARAILNQVAPMTLRERIHYPRSWFLAADAYYRFTLHNDLVEYANQKYKSEDEIRAEYPEIRAQFEKGRFPEEYIHPMREILAEVGNTPLIVRSSSLLEDSFDWSFAGKYESVFCANQGTPKENLAALVKAIADVYSGVSSPDALLYRQTKGLVDYDERMAILIQEVRGHRVNGYVLPDAAGVAYSQNQYRWSPIIDREAGFLRLVWGLGTRAVDQLGGDYPRLVALSHPMLRPDTDPARIRRFSQRQVDLIDLESNALRTLPVSEVLNGGTPNLRWIGQRYQDGVLQDFITSPLSLEPPQLVITFSALLQRSQFASDMSQILKLLEGAYRRPVDVEFLAMLDADPRAPDIYVLQCRPQSQLELKEFELPGEVPADRLLLTSHRLVPNGHVSGIRYVVWIAHEAYLSLPTDTERAELARLVGRLNTRLADESFVLIGPGRWGSRSLGLGIPAGYGDIYNARALVEVVEGEHAPEPSYGTHFFQDMVEAGIYPLTVAADDDFNRELLIGSDNVLLELLPKERRWEPVVRVIRIPDGQSLELVMNGAAGQAVAYLTDD